MRIVLIGLGKMGSLIRETAAAAGDEIEIDFDSGQIHNRTKQETYQAAPFPPFIQKIMKDNGLMNAIRKGDF